MIVISRRQAAEGVAVCDQMLAILTKLQADFDALKAASDQFSADEMAAAQDHKQTESGRT